MCNHIRGGEEEQHQPSLISLSLCLLRLQQLRPKLDGDGELVATNAGVGEG
jgi:hypothetical protein